jgi:aryl-alcohol dehydrogenase-like predicted oxidoreductase
MLPRRRLGKTDLEPSVIGLGTVKFGRNQSVKYPQGFNLPSDDELRELLAI